MSRRTIHYWIETGRLDRELSAGADGYAPRPPVAHKLDPYKAIVDARLEAFPKLSAKRLFDEVRAAGYAGCYSRVSDYVRAARPREPADPSVRFETPAGRQGQVDFGTFALPWGRRHALVIVLRYSRLLWPRFYAGQTMTVLMDGLESAFERFGGVPDELLFDQMRSVVLSDDRAAGGDQVADLARLVDGRDQAVAGAGQRPGAVRDLLQDGGLVETRADPLDGRAQPGNALARRRRFRRSLVEVVHGRTLH